MSGAVSHEGDARALTDPAKAPSPFSTIASLRLRRPPRIWLYVHGRATDDAGNVSAIAARGVLIGQ